MENQADKYVPNGQNHPVVIAGAGPAGLAASLQLGMYKIQHVLLEKGSFPKDKICGDALSGKVLDNLGKIDPGLRKRMPEMTPAVGSYGVKFVAPNGKELDIPFQSDLSQLETPPGYLSKRIHFDQFLFNELDNGYCDYRPHTVLKKIRKESGGLVLSCEGEGGGMEMSCDVLIGAEGDRSVVARQLTSRVMDEDHYCAGLRRYYSGVTGMHEKNFIELHFIKDILPGYFWIFPLPGGEVNAGIGMLSGEISRRKINLRAAFLDIIQNHPAIAPRFQKARPLEEPRGWGLPLGSRELPLAGDHFMLAGDAAALIDPFTGEGIGNALLSGRMAAGYATRALALRRFDDGFLSQYTVELYGKLRRELKLSRALQRLSAKAWLFNFVVGKAAANTALQETITCMFEDVGLRSRLTDPRFYFRLLFNRN